MPAGLERQHRTGLYHFITCSCFRHMPFLGSAEQRCLFIEILQEATEKYRCELIAYVAMPEHFHLILSEPAEGTIATIMQVIKQKFSRKTRAQRPDLVFALNRRAGVLGEMQIWETRYYDRSISDREALEGKIHYIHYNPVRRELAVRPEEWQWSSAHFYFERSKRRYLVDGGASAP